MRGVTAPLVRAVPAALAIAFLPATLSAQPAELAARSQQATQAMNDGRFEEAVELYRDMLKGRPNDAGLLMNLGMALAMAGHESDAIEPLQRAIRLRPTLVPAHLFLGSS